MAKQIRIDAYYDIGCSVCGSHWSTDFNHGLRFSRKALRQEAKQDGWIYDEKFGTVCPKCVKSKAKA